VAAAGPRVLKHEIAVGGFPRGWFAPAPGFETYDAAATTLLKCSRSWRLVLASFSGITISDRPGAGELADHCGAERQICPLPDAVQSGRVRFHRAHRYYLRSQYAAVRVPPRPRTVSVPRGIHRLKAAWLDMAGFPAEQVKRFITRGGAMVRDPDTGAGYARHCGVVGSHIVEKTPTRPQWIWSSYDRSTTCRSRFGDPVKFTFHDGGKLPCRREPAPLAPLARQPVRRST